MIVFLGGIHGVGKTYLAKPAAEALGVRYATASQLISEVRGRNSWDNKKVVDEIDENQAALVKAVKQLRENGENLLLDGHFVLRTARNRHEAVSESVFRDLDIDATVILQCSSSIVLNRLMTRGDTSWNIDELDRFAEMELEHASFICNMLNIRAITLREPTLSSFLGIVRDLLGR